VIFRSVATCAPHTTPPWAAALLQHAPDEAGRQRDEQPEGQQRRTRLRRGELAAAPLGEPRRWRPRRAMHRYVEVGTYRAACLSAASGGMMCPSCPPLATTAHASTSACAKNRTICTWEATRDELALSRTNRYFRLAVRRPQAARDGVSSTRSGRALPRSTKPAALTTVGERRGRSPLGTQ
jgi:hypothetical protein